MAGAYMGLRPQDDTDGPAAPPGASATPDPAATPPGDAAANADNDAGASLGNIAGSMLGDALTKNVTSSPSAASAPPANGNQPSSESTTPDIEDQPDSASARTGFALGNTPDTTTLHPAAVANAVTGVINDGDRSTRATVQQALKGNPDQAARALVLSQQTNKPFDLVLRNLDQFERETQLDDLADQFAGTPILKEQMSDPEFARMAVDDMNVLDPIEHRIRQWGELKAWEQPEGNLKNTAIGLLDSMQQGTDGLRLELNEEASDFMTWLGLSHNEDPNSPDYWYRQGLSRDVTQLKGDIRDTTPQFDSETAQDLYGDASSLIRAAPAAAVSILTKNPTPLLAIGALSTQADAYSDFTSRGVSGSRAFLGAAADALVDYAVNRITLSQAGGILKSTGFAKSLASMAGTNITAGQIQSFLHDAIDMAVTNPDKTWADFLKERPEAAYRALVGSLFQTALFGWTKALSGLGTALTSWAVKPPVDGNETLPQTSSDPARLQAQVTADSIGRVADLAAQSKLLRRDPASFQSSVQQMAAANGVDTLHISSTDFMDALMAQGPQAAMATLQRMPSVLAQLQKLPAIGGDLAIPTGEMITGITGSGAEAQILPHLRLTPDKLSLAQLQQEATASEAVSHKAPETNQDSPSFYFRGTTRGYTGSEATRQSGSTPTSWHPGVATLFATQAEQHGSGVLHIATPEDLSGISTGGKNWRSGLEKEIGVDCRLRNLRRGHRS